MNSFFHSSKIRLSFLTLLSTVVLSISLFGALSVSAQSSVKDDFNNFDEVYEEKAKICAKSALIKLVVQAVLSMAGTQVPTVDWSKAIKENIEDCLIWAFKAALIETLSMGTVKYVQTGFDGNPAFVQNIGDYLREIGNGVAGTYIEDTVPFLCSPFQLQIKLALTNVYRQSQGLGNNPSCTLSDAVENIQDYLTGDFASGGWKGWYEFTSNPYNNPLGALMEGSQQLSLRVSSKQGTEQVKLNLGSGFFGKEEQTCYAFQSLEDETGTPFKLLSPKETVKEALDRLGLKAPGGTECDEPKIITPGETIKSNLEQAFGTNLDNIVSADELNEIIDLAIGYITYHVLVGEGGLAGYKSEDFEYTGDYEPGVDPSIDTDLPPVTSSCGTGGWLRSNAEIAGNPIHFERNGFVFEPQDGNGEIEFKIPGVQEDEYYQTMTMSVDVEVGPASPEMNEPSDVYQMMYVRRAEDWQENAIGMLNVQANRGRFVAEHNMNIEIGDCTKADATNFTFVEGERYNLSYTYDTIAGQVTSTVRNAGGQIVAQTYDTPTADMIQTSHPRGGGAGFTVVLGSPNNGHEVTPTGWKFSNLKVDFEAPEPIDPNDDGGGDDETPPPEEEEVARIFIDDLGTPNKNELYSESTSGIVTKISQALGPDGDVFTFERTPDGEHVVYSADVQNDRAELFVVPSAGGTITKISTPTTLFDDGTSSDVIRFDVSPDGQRVAYTADTSEWTKYELFSVALTGGTVTRISHQLPFDYDVDDFKFSPSSQRIIYRAGRTSIGLWELYSTPSTSAGAIRISQDMDTGQNVAQNGFEISCNSQTTYFLADLIGGVPPVLFSTPTTGGTITEVGGGQLPGNICS